MGKQIQLKFNSDGFKEILRSDGAWAVCEEAGSNIQSRANAALNDSNSKGFKMSTRMVKAYKAERPMTFVYTTDRASMIAEAEHKALSKAVY